MSWTAGYVSDIEYSASLFRELFPAHLVYALEANAVVAPSLEGPFRYCELACGQGLTTLAIATLYPEAEVFGLDFNPAQIDRARGYAKALAIPNVTFVEQSFHETLAAPPVAPGSCDYVVAHGIYSWIDDENRQAIVDLYGLLLRAGGVAYVSYNALPGWAAAMPLQRLLFDEAARHTGDSVTRFAAARDFASKLQAVNAAYWVQNPSIPHRMASIVSQNPAYLSHEYLNANWHPKYFADVVAELSEVKLDWAASAILNENGDIGFLPEAMRALILAEPDVIRQQTLRDYAANTTFRRDLFVRGKRKIANHALGPVLDRSVFALQMPRESISLKFKTGVGELTGVADQYAPLLDRLAAGPASFLQLREHCATSSIIPQSVLSMLSHLVQSGQVTRVFDTSAEVVARCRRFNTLMAREALRDLPNFYLCIPAARTCLPQGYIEALCYLAIIGGASSTDEMIVAMDQHLKESGRQLVQDGQIVTDSNIARGLLSQWAMKYATGMYPHMKALGVF